MVNGGMVEVKGGGALNPKFFHLPEERQDLIRNSAMLEFGDNTFKKTSADSIARRAGVSKGLLFHYIFRLKTAFSHSWEKGSGWIERAPIPA